MDNTVITFGCRLNIYESEVIRTAANKAELTDAIIINTCAVTNEAERQARQAIRKAKRENPLKTLIVTGCAAQKSPHLYENMPEVDHVLGNHDKLKPESYTLQHKTLVSDIRTAQRIPHVVTNFEGKSRAFIEVQNGCNHSCTFCSIPQGRGPSRSTPIGAIVAQTRLLLEKGFKEIVLTGVDLTSYGEDLPGKPTFYHLVKRLLAHVPELPRLRLSSLDPAEIDENLIELITKEKRIMPHIHLSVQSGANLILKRMKRRHLRERVFDVTTTLKNQRSDIVFGADIIAGFPTETDQHFADSLDIAKCFTYLHVFPYSPRRNTPAARIPQLSASIIKKRARILRMLDKKQRASFYASCIGRQYTALIEKNGVSGHTEHFAPIIFTIPVSNGALVSTQVIDATPTHLIGRPL